MRTARLVLAGLLVAGLGLLATGCGSDDDAADSGTGVEVTDAWARASAAMQNAGAAYMKITSKTDKVLVSASVPVEVAAKVELHETVMAEGGSDTTMGGGMGSDTTMGHGDMGQGGGAMTMRPVEKIELPAGQTVELKPGGLHVMLLDLAEPLEVGQQFTLTLTFDDGTTLPVEVTVREQAP